MHLSLGPPCTGGSSLVMMCYPWLFCYKASVCRWSCGVTCPKNAQYPSRVAWRMGLWWMNWSTWQLLMPGQKNVFWNVCCLTEVECKEPLLSGQNQPSQAEGAKIHILRRSLHHATLWEPFREHIQSWNKNIFTSNLVCQAVVSKQAVPNTLLCPAER